MITIVEDPKVTSEYGVERTLPDGKKHVHEGIDFVSGTGDRTVYCVASGVVEYDYDDYCHARRLQKPNTGGNMVIISSVIKGKVYHIRYLHLVENYVKKGDVIIECMPIGKYGDVGYSFGAHVHIDVWTADWGKRINPRDVLIL